jgi:hypothetical protein
MSISLKDSTQLWGLAAGRCSRPGCGEECIKFFTTDPTSIGEMAHVIAKSPDGPRGVPAGGDNTYQNLKLLCPTHPTEIDKAPAGTFPPSVLLDWKRRHEAGVGSALASPIFSSTAEIGQYIKRLLIENKAVWQTYGPDSFTARLNPISNVSAIWTLRKLATIVPNNRRIVTAIQRNSSLFQAQAYAVSCLFVEHTEGFEANCYGRTENVPRFPQKFEDVIDGYVA